MCYFKILSIYKVENFQTLIAKQFENPCPSYTLKTTIHPYKIYIQNIVEFKAKVAYK